MEWHSKTRRRMMRGYITDFTAGKAYIIQPTWDGRGHHWIEPLSKLRKVNMGGQEVSPVREVHKKAE